MGWTVPTQKSNNLGRSRYDTSKCHHSFPTLGNKIQITCSSGSHWFSLKVDDTLEQESKLLGYSLSRLFISLSSALWAGLSAPPDTVLPFSIPPKPAPVHSSRSIQHPAVCPRPVSSNRCSLNASRSQGPPPPRDTNLPLVLFDVPDYSGLYALSPNIKSDLPKGQGMPQSLSLEGTVFALTEI